MPSTPLIISVRDTEEPIRLEGYTEEVMFNEGAGNVSFAAGQYRCRLDLYLGEPEVNTPPLKRVQHTIGTDPTLALMILTPSEMQLLNQDSYIRKVFVTTPTGQQYRIVNGYLNPIT